MLISFWIPAGAEHSLTNTGEEGSVILVIASPGW